MTKKITILLLVVIMTSGCSYNRNKDEISQNYIGDSECNMDIRDTALEISNGFSELGDINGEKVTAMGIVSDVEENMGACPVFKLVVSEGDNSLDYEIKCQMSIEDFKKLNLVDGSSVKVFGTGEETEDGVYSIINATLIDKEM